MKVKVIEAKKGLKSLFPQCETSVSNNSSSIKHRSVEFVFGMGFWLWLIEWHGQHLCHMTGSDHT